MSDIKVTALPNGPYMIEGAFQLLDAGGKLIDTSDRPRVALCRCGHSANKPFCDGAHAREGFQDPPQG
ncbi:MAG: CDGSH iron-sulfur domain-containing protein [Candidatus Latescibacterota bacterium]|nr:MAG: CDGSH iron-sulfur domain-containing protein [Candidatus Latescibacterota bacterium]